MAQAQRVAHLVHDGFLDVVLHELPGHRAVRVHFALCLQHVQRITQLFSGQRAVHAAGPLGRHLARLRQLERMGKAERHRRAFGSHGYAGRRAEHLGAQAANAACGHALERDVRIQDLARARVHVAGADGAEDGLRVHHPAHACGAKVQGVELGVVGLLLHLDGVADADFLEGPVPFQDAASHGLTVGQRHVAVDPEGDGLDRVRYVRRRVLLLQPPAVHEALAW